MIEVESDGALRVEDSMPDSWTSSGYSLQTLCRVSISELVELYKQKGFRVTIEKIATEGEL